MEKKNKCERVVCTRFLWAVMLILLLASPILRADETVPEGQIWDINYDVTGSDPTGALWVWGTANILPGAVVTDGLYIQEGGSANIYGGVINQFISVSPDAAGMTVYGTDLYLDGNPVGYGEVSLTGDMGTLTGIYGDGSEINLLIFSNIPINLQPPAPDDPVQLIEDLIDYVFALNLQNGIENSLDAKLDAALNALDDVNTNNDVAAINTLQAFISAVEAQRDNKITSEQADELIADAQEIIDLLSTQ